MMRTFTLILLTGVTMMLLGCGLSTPAQVDEPTPQVAEPTTLSLSTGEQPPSVAMISAPQSPYVGDSLIEEKIIESPVIVRATMTTFSSEVITEADGRYSTALKFSLGVSEYLKGAGPSSIVAVWVDGRSYDTSAEANDAKTVILAERDDQWDDRVAIFFLYGDAGGFGSKLDEQLERADHFLLYVGDPYSPDNFYSLHSRRHKAWLPSDTSTSSTVDDQEFLLDVPPPPGSSSTAPTITLGNLKQRIAEVTAEFNSGDGSQAYRDCVIGKYRYLRNQQNFPEEMGRPFTTWHIDHSIASGLPAGTVLAKTEALAAYPDEGTRMPVSFAGTDAVLFNTKNSDPIDNYDYDKDGEYDSVRYEIIAKLARPLPAGEYKSDLNESDPAYSTCNFVISNEWTVTVNAPAGTVHEAFFDPVTDGTAVAADDSNGVLKPAMFTDASGALATLERIAWEPGAGETGTVKLQVNPPTGLTDQEVNFIALDGSIILSLQVANATVDAANRTLSWAVASQPWQSGDLLMLRIRKGG